MEEDRHKPRVTNIRVTLFLEKEGVQLMTAKVKEPHFRKINNFFMVSTSTFIYTIFPNSDKIGVTRVKQEQDLACLQAHFVSTFCLPTHVVKDTWRIDNISATGSFQKEVNLARLKNLVNERYKKGSSLFLIQFDRNFRAEAICRTFSIGNITLFSSGKYFIVGAKTFSDVHLLVENLFSIIRDGVSLGSERKKYVHLRK